MELLNTYSLLKNHIIDGKFARSDFFVRLLAIENYYGKNDFGIDIYNKMQKQKGAKAFDRGKCSFCNIVESFEKNGFILHENNYIVMNKVLRLTAGAHRLACCLYFYIESVPFYVDFNTKKDTIRGVKWFRDKKFDSKSINRIIERQEAFLNGCI